MADQEQYISLISDIIAKQAVILGPDIALLKARAVPGLTIDTGGKVVGVSGDPQAVLKKLVDTYVELSGEIVRTALSSVFQKYPSIQGLP